VLTGGLEAGRASPTFVAGTHGQVTVENPAIYNVPRFRRLRVSARPNSVLGLRTVSPMPCSEDKLRTGPLRDAAGPRIQNEEVLGKAGPVSSTDAEVPTSAGRSPASAARARGELHPEKRGLVARGE